MYMSVFHWLPIVNGHTAYFPTGYPLLESYGAQLPSGEALQTLVDCAGLRWILVETAQDDRRSFAGLSGVRLQAEFEATDLDVSRRLYEVQREPLSPCRLEDLPADTTAQGNPVHPVRASARLTMQQLPARAVKPGERVRLRLRLHNEGALPWPATALDSAARVDVHAAWSNAHAQVPAIRTVAIPRDVPPHESYDFDVWIQAPRRGSHVLSLQLRQGERVLDEARHSFLVGAPRRRPPSRR
jgi:hypothetical protein